MKEKNDLKSIREDPRVNSFKPDVHIRPFKKVSDSIKSVRLAIIDIDAKCKQHIDSGEGFFITDEEDYDEKKGVRTTNGLFSPKFGIDTFSDKITDEHYHCECGHLVGGLYEGEICDVCKSVVSFADSKLSIFGYINLGKFTTINPAIFVLLKKLIGEKDLNEIIRFNNRFNVKGKNVSTKTKSTPYHGIGMIEFSENFDEIAAYYRDKRKRFKEYELVMKYRKCIFAHNVPVFSALLRPLVKDESRVAVFKVNKMYSTILVNANIIRGIDIPGVTKKIIVENCLFEIQNEFMAVYNEVVDNSLASKTGLLRGKLLANKVDSSARMVIVPAVGHDVDEVSLPYAAGCELLRPLIIRQLVSIDKINIRTANSIVDDALRKFDKRIWLIMNNIIQNSKNPPRLMTQRSPSLLQESMRLMRIKQINPSTTDLVLDTPEGILSGMNADFDGDTFSNICIYDNRLKASWEPIHSPIYHFVSRHDGLYSSSCEFIKDSGVILSELWECGKDVSYYRDHATNIEVWNRSPNV